MLRDVHTQLGGKGGARIGGDAVHGAEVVACQDRGRDVFIRRHPDVFKAVVDINLARVLIHLFGYDQKEDAEQGDDQDGADQQVFQFSVAGCGHNFLRKCSHVLFDGGCRVYYNTERLNVTSRENSRKEGKL